MRIITGSAKGQKIEVPYKDIRPAQSIVRHSVFSMLYGLVEGAQVLDLFAGSGSYGLEALSRGAEKAVFVDNDPKSIRAIKINLKKMGFENSTSGALAEESRGEVIQTDAMSFVENRTNSKFDLIFLSPPYSIGAQIHLLKQLEKILNLKGVIIFDHAKETELPQKVNSLKIIRQRGFGATSISILAKKS